MKSSPVQSRRAANRRLMGIERSTFLIDEKGKITGVYEKVKVDGHAAAVLEAVAGKS